MCWGRRTADGTAEGEEQAGYSCLYRSQAWDCMRLPPIFAETVVWRHGQQGMQCRHTHSAGQHACTSAADPDAAFTGGRQGMSCAGLIRHSSLSGQQLTVLNHFSRRE